MNDLKERLTTAIADYCCNDTNGFDAGNMAEYLMNVIDELKVLKRSIGSKVKIRSDLIPNENYGGTCFMEEMLPYIGKQAVITGYENEEDCAPAYLLDVDDSFWSWNEDMLENPE